MRAARQPGLDNLTFALSLGEQGAKSYRRLLRALGMARGRFHLFPVESNFSAVERDKLLSMLRADLAESGICLRPVMLGADRWDAPALIEREPPIQENDVLVLLGLEETPGIVREGGAEAIRPPALALLNQSRETLRMLVHAPLIVWCPSYAFSALAVHAPDLFDQYTGVFRFHREPLANLESVRLQNATEPAVLAGTVVTQTAITPPSLVSSYVLDARRKTLANYPASSPERATALVGMANLLCEQQGIGRIIALQEAQTYAEEAMSLLEQHTDPSSQREWASANFILAYILSEIPVGWIDRQLCRAIACYEDALHIYNKQVFPRDWATTQNNLGNAYVELLSGDRDENLRRAIACYEAALRVRTEQALPQHWAMTQTNLSATYSCLRYGDRDENLRRAIVCCEAALRVITEQQFPQEWAMAQNNLGTAYIYLPSGDRNENLRHAIAHLDAALRVTTEQAFPRQWAMTMSNSGEALLKLGDIAGAFERLYALLRVATENEYPLLYGETQARLGNVFLKQGDNKAARVHFANAVRAAETVGMPPEWEWRAEAEARLRELAQPEPAAPGP